MLTWWCMYGHFSTDKGHEYLSFLADMHSIALLENRSISCFPLHPSIVHCGHELLAA